MAPLVFLMPPVTFAVSWLHRGESFTLIQVAGALIALTGVALAQFGRAIAGFFTQRFAIGE